MPFVGKTRLIFIKNEYWKFYSFVIKKEKY